MVVVSWNTRALLADCLRSLQADALERGACVCVVDNASGDGSAQMVASEFPWVRLIASASNLGFGAAVNQGVWTYGVHLGPHASKGFVAVANADTCVAPGALAALRACAVSHPGVGIVAPRLILADGSTQQSLHPFPGLVSAFAANVGLPGAAGRLPLDGGWDASRPRRIDWAHGAFLLLRREAFTAVGGFDPAQFLYAEDLDLCWRIARAGWRARYEPTAVVRHAHGAAISKLWGDERDARAQRSAYAWMLRRQGAARMRAWALVNTAGAAGRAGPASLAARRRGPEAQLRAWQLRRWTRIHLQGLLASRRALERHR